MTRVSRVRSQRLDGFDVNAQPRKGVTDELEDQNVARCFRPHRFVGVYRIEKRGQPRSIAFHLCKALLRTRRKHALSGRDGGAAQDELRAAGVSDQHRQRLYGFARVLRRIRRGLGGRWSWKTASTILRPQLNSASSCKVSFPSPPPAVKRGGSLPAACFD